jgi:hypothetical protein
MVVASCWKAFIFVWMSGLLDPSFNQQLSHNVKLK